MEFIGEFAAHVDYPVMSAPADTRVVQRQVPVPYPADHTVIETVECVDCDYGPCAQACNKVNRFSHSGPQCPLPGKTNVQHQCPVPEKCKPLCLALKDCIRQCPMTSAGPNPCPRPAQECNARCPMSQMSGSSFELSPFVQSPRPKMHVQRPSKRGELYEPFPTPVGHCKVVGSKIPGARLAPGFLPFRGVNFLPEPTPPRVSGPGEKAGNTDLI